MKSVVNYISLVTLAIAAIPAVLGIALLWAVYRLTDKFISIAERSGTPR